MSAIITSRSTLTRLQAQLYQPCTLRRGVPQRPQEWMKKVKPSGRDSIWLPRSICHLSPAGGISICGCRTAMVATSIDGGEAANIIGRHGRGKLIAAATADYNVQKQKWKHIPFSRTIIWCKLLHKVEGSNNIATICMSTGGCSKGIRIMYLVVARSISISHRGADMNLDFNTSIHGIRASSAIGLRQGETIWRGSIRRRQGTKQVQGLSSEMMAATFEKDQGGGGGGMRVGWGRQRRASEQKT